MDVATVAPLVPAVVALVAMVRAKFPKIDGPVFVLGLAFLASLVMLFVYGTVTAPVELARSAVALSLAAIGVVWGIDRHASGGGSNGASSTTTDPAPPPT